MRPIKHQLFAVLALLLITAGALPHRAAASTLTAAVRVSTAYGDPIPITDPGNPSAVLLPTGVNDSGVVAATDSTGPVAWSFSGTGSGTTTTVTRLQPPTLSESQYPGYTSGVSNSGSFYGTGDICVPTAGCGYHAVEWSGTGPPTDLGFGEVSATSPGGTFGGIIGLDTGTQEPSGAEIFNCGPFIQRGPGSPAPLPSTETQCDGNTSFGPYSLSGAIGLPFSPLIGVDDAGVGVIDNPESSTFSTTEGPTLNNYCAIGQVVSRGPIISSAGVIGYECNPGNQSVGAIWNAGTGSFVTLPRAPGSQGTFPAAIDNSGEIFGEDSSGPAFWRTPTSAPVQLDTGAPVHVSGNGEFLVTQPTYPETAYQLYRLVNKTPPLKATISFPSSAGGTPNPDPGQTIDVEVSLTTGKGSGNLDGLTFQGGDPLQINPSGALSVVSGPTPPDTGPFTMAPQTTKTFTYKLKAVKVGMATLSTAVSGQADDGSTVSASDAASVQIGLNLQVALTYAPATIKIPLDKNDAPIPQPFSLKVTVTNPFTKTLKHVQLDKLPILERQADDIAVPVEQDPKAKPPNLSLGTLAAGASKSVTFPFLATTDGLGKITWSAQAENPDNAAQTIKGVGSVVVSIDPTKILDFKLSLTSGSGILTSGDKTGANLVITNLTNADVVNLDSIDPALTGNLGGGDPVDSDRPPPAGAFPISASPHLGPGDVKALSADLQTVPSQGTRGTVIYHLTGKIEKPDGTKDDLADADVIYEPKDGMETIHINDSAPSYESTHQLASSVANFTFGFAEGEESWLLSTFATVAWLLKSTPKVILAVDEAPLQLLQTVDYYVTYWSYLTPDARDSWYGEIAHDIVAQTDAFGKTELEVKHKVNQLLTPWLNSLSTAWYAGDWNTVALHLGEVSGNVVLETAGFTISLPEAGEVISLGDAAKEAGVAKRVSQGLRALQAGDDLAQAGNSLSRLYGLTVNQVQALQELAKAKGLLIAVRQRNPLSIQWEKLGALLKPEAIKIKSVDQIDTAFLGYRKVDEGSVVFKQPVTKQQLVSSTAYKSADQVLQEAAVDRLAARTKEWNKYDAQYQQMAKPLTQGGGVDVAFNYPANGSSVPPQTSVAEKVAFELDPVASQGPGYYLVRIADSQGQLERVTGDVDLVGVTLADGGTMNANQRLDVYLNLQDILGIQHGDTLSWIKDGEPLWDTKSDLLKDHLPGGEPLAVFDPAGSARVSFVQPTLTYFNSKSKVGRIWYVGGYRTPKAVVYHFGSLAYPMFTSAYQNVSPFLTPLGWVHQISQPPPPKQQVHLRFAPTRPGSSTGTLAGKCTWQFSASPSAGVVYPDNSGGLQQWTKGGGWQPLDISSCWYATTPAAGGPLGADHVLNLLPMSSLTTDSTTGATHVTLNGLANIDPSLPAKTPWFAAHQSIVLDPGQSDQETDTVRTATITSTSVNLTLATPLTHRHLAGDIVAATGPSH